MIKADFNLSANFNIKKQAALDPRFVVTTKADLIDKDHWAHDGGTYYVYEGLLVAVADTGKVFMLTDKTKLLNTDYSGWIDVTGTTEIPNATSTSYGTVKLGSDTVQSIAAAPATSEVGRTFPIQKNSSNQLVVNVPAAEQFTSTERAQLLNALGLTTVNSISGAFNSTGDSLTITYDTTALGQMVNSGDAKTLSIDAVSKDFVLQNITDAITGVTQFNYEVVTTLPATGTKGTIYLKAATDAQGNDIYEEYIWVNSKFEKLGTTAKVDLTGYLKDSGAQTLNGSLSVVNSNDNTSGNVILNNKLVKVYHSDGTSAMGRGEIYTEKNSTQGTYIYNNMIALNKDNVFDTTPGIMLTGDTSNTKDYVFWNTNGGYTAIESIADADINALFA